MALAGLSVRRAPLFWVAVAAGIGIALAWVRPVPFALSFSVCCGLLVFLRWCGERMRIWAVMGCAAAAFFFYGSVRFYSYPPEHLIHRMSDDPHAERIKLQIANKPRTRTNSRNKKRVEFTGKVLEIEKGGVFVKTGGKVLVVAGESREREYAYGQVLVIRGFLEGVPRPRDFGEFDYGAYLFKKGITQRFIFRPEDAQIVAEGRGNGLVKLAYDLQDYMNRVLRLGLEDDPQMSELMAGMLFGYTDGIAEELEEKFQVTGTLHLFAVSGQNVGVIAMMMLFMLQLLGVLRWRWGWLTLPALCLFCLATGMESSATRALIMVGLVFAGWRLYRPVHLLNSLGAAALLMWIWNPVQLLDVGFQLSFCVVLGLILGAGPVTKYLRALWEPDPFIPVRLLSWKRKALDAAYRGLCAFVAVSVVAWLVSLPLTLYHFHLFAPVTLVANVLVVPLAGLVVMISSISVVASFAWSGLSVIVNQVNWLILKLIVLFVGGLASVPGGHAYLRYGFLPEREESFRMILLGGDGVAPAVLSTDNRHFLIDAGTQREWKRVLNPLRKQLGLEGWDGLILSQNGARHASGMIPMMEEMDVPFVVESGWQGRSPVQKRGNRFLEERGIPKRFYGRGQEWQMSPSVKLRFIWPPPEEKAKRVEDRGLAFRIEHERVRVLWAGAISSEVEGTLIRETKAEDLRADILVQGDSRNGKNLSSAWLRAVSPRDLIRPARGFYPDDSLSREFWETCKERGIRVWLMDETGGLRIELGEKEAEVIPFLRSTFVKIE